MDRYNADEIFLPALSLQIIRSGKRKHTISLSVHGDTIIVRAPADMPDADIQRILERKRPWIEEAIKSEAERAQETEHAVWHQRLHLLGDAVTVQIHPRTHASWFLAFEKNALTIHGPADSADHPMVKKVVVDWLRRRAAEEISKRVELWSQRLHLTYRSVKIKEQKSRWGSCSRQGNLNFNWRLIQAPVGIMDYVVVHELCHLEEMNHSSRFWKLVEQAIPNHLTQRHWLKTNGHLLYW